MTTNDEILKKASNILEKFRVGELIAQLVQGYWKYQSTPEVEFIQKPSNIQVPSELQSWVSLKAKDQVLIVGFGEFGQSSAPDDDAMYADAYAYFNGEQVLHTGAEKEYTEWGSRIRIFTYPFSIKAFKAGPWLELLGEWTSVLETDYLKREEEKRQVRVALQASHIDLADYE